MSYTVNPDGSGITVTNTVNTVVALAELQNQQTALQNEITAIQSNLTAVQAQIAAVQAQIVAIGGAI